MCVCVRSVEKEYVQQELVSTREKARLMLLDQGEQLAQGVLDTSLLLQRVCALIDNTTTSDNHKVHTRTHTFIHFEMNTLHICLT